VVIDKDGLGLVPDRKSPVESGLCHAEWAVPGYWDGIFEKAHKTEEPLGSEVRTHTEPESMDVLAEEVVQRDVGLEGQKVCPQNNNSMNTCNGKCDLLEHDHMVNARPVEGPYCTRMTKAVQITPVERRTSGPRDGEHTLKYEKTHRVLSPSYTAVMVHEERKWNDFTHCIQCMPPEQPSLVERKEKTYDYG